MADQLTSNAAISWREWNESAFATARSEGKPLLLTLTATWCHWCHVMDQTSYSDGRVIERINSGFIPMRVDVDRRPDISRRYNQGGFPSVAALGHDGGLLAGRVYTPPEEMLELLERVTASFPEPPEPVASRSRPGPGGYPYGGAGESPDERVLRRLEELYDPLYGGFGREPKQPPWEGLRFFLDLYGRYGGKHYRKMVTDSLDGIIAGLYDEKDQGFFRYSVSRDWKVPHYEKMVVTNANLATLLLETYQLIRKPSYKKAAIGALHYLETTLYDGDSGLFASSQDAWEDFYRLPWKDRDTAEKPTVDRTAYTGWNAWAAGAFVKAAGVLGTASYRRVGVRTLENLWSQTWDQDTGLRHAVGGTGEQPLMLEDHVAFLRASLDLYQATADAVHLQRAVLVADCIDRLFGPAEGGYVDVAGAGSVGVPLSGDRPVLENSLLAEALVVLGCLTGDDSRQERAALALEAFEEVVSHASFLGSQPSRVVEEDEEALFMPAASAWARARRLLAAGPVHLFVVGRAGHPVSRRLRAAALGAYLPHRVLQVLDPETDRDRIRYMGFPLDNGPVENEPVLYACMNNMCLAPLRSPQEVRRLPSERPWANSPDYNWAAGPTSAGR